MPPTDSPSIAASALHQVDRATALSLVDSLLGEASEWSSPLLRYRLASEFQSDWKEEIGHWLRSAQEHGFLLPLLGRLLKRAKRLSKLAEVDPNDKHHLVVLQELAPAMAVYYLTRTG